jgi:hypothetical protein
MILLTPLARVSMTQVAAVMGYKSRVLLKTIRAFTGANRHQRLDGRKCCIWTGVVGMPIIRVAHKAVDLKVLAVPLACPMRWSAENCHGHSRTTPQASRPGLDARQPSRGGDVTRKGSGPGMAPEL